MHIGFDDLPGGQAAKQHEQSFFQILLKVVAQSRQLGMEDRYLGREDAQSTLYALLAPEVAQHSDEYYSQIGLYRDKQARKVDRPLYSPNPGAHDDKVAERLWAESAALVQAIWR